MSKSAIAVGIILTLLGLWISLKIITSDETPLLVIIYPAIMIALGIAMIILNKEESKVEQRKDINTKEA